jgi:hypothetical protein
MARIHGVIGWICGGILEHGEIVALAALWRKAPVGRHYLKLADRGAAYPTTADVQSSLS